MTNPQIELFVHEQIGVRKNRTYKRIEQIINKMDEASNKPKGREILGISDDPQLRNGNK